MNQSGLALIAYPSRVIAGSRRRTRRGRRRPSLRRGRGLVSFLSCHAFPRSRSLVYRRRRQRKHASIRDAAKSSCLLKSLPRCREPLACLHGVSHHPQPAHSRSPCQPGSPASRERITLGNHVARAAARHTARAERGRRCSSSSSGEGDVELLRLPCCFPLPRPSFRSSSSRTLWQWHRRPWSWCDDIAVPSQASQDCKWRADRSVGLMADRCVGLMADPTILPRAIGRTRAKFRYRHRLCGRCLYVAADFVEDASSRTDISDVCTWKMPFCTHAKCPDYGNFSCRSSETRLLFTHMPFTRHARVHLLIASIFFLESCISPAIAGWQIAHLSKLKRIDPQHVAHL